MVCSTKAIKVLHYQPVDIIVKYLPFVPRLNKYQIADKKCPSYLINFINLLANFVCEGQHAHRLISADNDCVTMIGK